MRVTPGCVRLFALLLLFASPATARAEEEAEEVSFEKEGQLRLSLQGGYDTNVRRDYAEAGTEPPTADVLGSAILSADGRLTGERLELRGSYDGGVRKFLKEGDSDLLTQGLLLESSYLLGRRFGVGLEGGGKDRRGGDRDYTDLQAGAFVDLYPDTGVDLRLRAGAHRFLYWKGFLYSFRGPQGGLTVRYRLSRRHAVTGFGFTARRLYRATARDAQLQERPGPVRRKDSVLEAGAGYIYRGPLAFSATYSYGESTSNSYGEAWRRHQLALTGGMRLPWQVTALLQLQLQVTSYPDGVFQSFDLLLQQDDENSNTGSLKLVRPLSERVEIEGRYALYQTALDVNDLTYLRHVAWLGFTLRL